MKKLFSILILVLLCANAMAYDFSAVCSTGQTLFYDNTSGLDYYSVSVGVENESYPYYNDNPTGDLVIPETVEFDGITYTVTAIGRNAFYNCSDLISVVIPNTVTEVGYLAFSACTGLTSITLPSSLTNVVDQAFSQCNALSSIYYLGSIEQWCGITFGDFNPLSYAHNLYIDNTLVTDLVIPETITEIKSYTFEGACFTSVTIPSSVTIINENAFLHCSSLTSIEFPSGLETIGGYAFQSCSALTSVTFPSTLQTIGDFAFYGCALEDVYGFEQTSVTSISDYTFANNYNLTNIKLPSTLNTINRGAFSNCGLTTINIPEGVTAINNYAFDACSSLTSIMLPSTLATIGEGAFNEVDHISIIKTKASTPPTLNEICFSETLYITATLWVPARKKETYMNDSQWGRFRIIRELPYWSCDFEGDEMWTFGNDQQAGNVQWQIVTSETYPSGLISGNNAYLKPFVFNGDTLSDTPEHWAMVEIISQMTDLGGSGQVAESPWIQFDGIDLSGSQRPKITFRQIFKQLNGVETTIRVSTDGGQTWTDHYVNEEVLGNEYGQNVINKGISISEAAGEENVIIRFLFNSDAHTTQMGYGWEIDDIEIVETPQCDVALKEARISMFGYVDYRNVPDDFFPTITNPDERRETAYQFYDPYAQSSRKQWATESGYAAFNVEVANYGYEAFMPMAMVKITNPNGVEIYNKEVSGIRELSTNEGDTIDFFNSDYFYFEGIESYEDIVIGRYTVDFYVFAIADDMDNTDNHTVQYFDISDNTFSMSYDEPTGMYNYYTYSTSASGDEYGIIFTYGYQPGKIEVDAYIDEQTTLGTAAQVIIYELDDNRNPVEVVRSDTLVITSGMPGSWVNFPINGNPLFNSGDTSYTFMATVMGIWNDGQTLALGTSDELTSFGHNCYMRLPNQSDTWYYAAPRLAIRVRELNEYNITVLSNNDSYGSVSGGGTYYEGDTAAIFAMPNSGYDFVSWNDGDELNPRTIVVTRDSTFIADFVKCEITQTIDTVVQNFVTVGDHTFYSTGNYTFVAPYETACDTIFDINLTVLAEPVYDISPNPTSKMLNINTDGFISHVEFYSTTGQLVMRKEVNGNFAECDVETFAPGVYIVRIFSDERNLPSVYKIVKE
ncbi:MAG: leucine-rich repeat domain-containing protein [Bacteroidales bacterium]|nr:leucine-rich repeat domain-containing protein [Bacteroidales bacterium]